MDIAKFFVLPCGKSLSPFKSDSLKSYVEEILGNLCIGLKASYSDEVFSTFFRNSFDYPGCNESLSILSQSGTDSYRGDIEFNFLHDIDRRSVDYSGCNESFSFASGGTVTPFA